MNEDPAVRIKHEALVRIVAALIAMVGLVADVTTIRRSLMNAVRRTLRPAEYATRRLALTMACALPLSSLRPSRPKPVTPPHLVPVREKIGMHCGVKSRFVWMAGAQLPKIIPLPPARPLTRLSFPLLDPQRNPFRRYSRHVPDHMAPRVLSLDGTQSARKPRPSNADQLDATRLRLRLSALKAALDDMPALARHLARWRARQQRARNLDQCVRWSPLGVGIPRCCRLKTFNPDAPRRSNIREIDEVLIHTHALAVFALDPRNAPHDTS